MTIKITTVWRKATCHQDKKYFAHGLCRDCYRKNHYKLNKSRYNESSRKSWLKIKYNLSPDQYNNILNSQNGHCLFCNSNKNLLVDHNHITGIVRGIVCKKHNTIIGFIENNLEFIDTVANYISRNALEKIA